MSQTQTQLPINQPGNTTDANNTSTTDTNTDTQTYEDTLIIEKLGGKLYVRDELPAADGDRESLEETDSIPSSSKTYPTTHGHGNVTVYRYRQSRPHVSDRTSKFKEFKISISLTGVRRSDAMRIKQLVSDLEELSELRGEIKSIESFTELREHADTIRAYETRYNVLHNIFREDYVGGTVTGTQEQHPQEFEITQRLGNYGVPSLYCEHANQLINEHLKKEGIGQYSVMHGIFAVEPGDFDVIHDTIKPFYKNE